MFIIKLLLLTFIYVISLLGSFRLLARKYYKNKTVYFEKNPLEENTTDITVQVTYFIFVSLVLIIFTTIYFSIINFVL